MDTFWVVVLRAMSAEGVELKVGDLVDAANWDPQRRGKLINQRWVRAATAQEVAEAEAEEEVEEQPAPPPRARARKKK